jgi:hypothetical protein
VTTSDGTWPAPPGDTRAEKLAWIVQHGQAGTVDGVFVDMVTANMLMTIRGTMTETGRRASLAVWDALPLATVIDIGWRVMRNAT